jgi:hypothetical protein
MWFWETVATWMSLERPSYLSYAQASGVVFSRETALKVAARAEVLRPVAPPEFVIGALFEKEYMPRKLTESSLQHICGDPELDFVVSADRVGIPVATKEWPRRGEFNHLYDCRTVRARRDSR